MGGLHDLWFDCLGWYSPWGWLSPHHSANIFWAASMGQVHGTIQKRSLRFGPGVGQEGGEGQASLKNENGTARQWIGEKVFFNHTALEPDIINPTSQRTHPAPRGWGPAAFSRQRRHSAPPCPPPPWPFSVCHFTVSAGHERLQDQEIRWGEVGSKLNVKGWDGGRGGPEEQVRGLLPSLLLSGHFP